MTRLPCEDAPALDENPAVELSVQNGEERAFINSTLPAFSQSSSPLALHVKPGVGDFNEDLSRQRGKASIRKREAASYVEGTRIEDELRKHEFDCDQVALPRVIDAIAEHVANRLRDFRIGHEPRFYPGNIVSSQQWCNLLRKCVALERVGLRACCEADDDVMDTLGSLRYVESVIVTGSCKASGKVTNAVISKLCRSVSNSDDKQSEDADGEISGGASGQQGVTKKIPEKCNRLRTPPLYFPRLKQLILTDQSAISYSDYERMKKYRLDIRFVYGPSGDSFLRYHMIGLCVDHFLDTHKELIMDGLESMNGMYGNYNWRNDVIYESVRPEFRRFLSRHEDIQSYIMLPPNITYPVARQRRSRLDGGSASPSEGSKEDDADDDDASGRAVEDDDDDDDDERADDDDDDDDDERADDEAGVALSVLRPGGSSRQENDGDGENSDDSEDSDYESERNSDHVNGSNSGNRFGINDFADGGSNEDNEGVHVDIENIPGDVQDDRDERDDAVHNANDDRDQGEERDEDDDEGMDYDDYGYENDNDDDDYQDAYDLEDEGYDFNEFDDGASVQSGGDDVYSGGRY